MYLKREGRHIAVKFILEDEKGRILIEKRNKDKDVLPSIWAIPSGHVDVSDGPNHLITAVKRECMEELNLVPKFIRYINKYNYRVPGRKYRIYYFHCKGFDKSLIPKVSAENAGLKWLNFDDKSSLPLSMDRYALSKMASRRLVLAVSGTPGTGKTTVSKTLAKTYNMGVLSLSEAISRNNLSSGYDKEKCCEIVSISALQRFYKGFLRENPGSWLIDGHLSHYLKPLYGCIICTTGLKTLKRRLEKRSYSAEKVRENLDSEIFKVCEAEAREAGLPVFLIDTTKRKSLDTPLFPVEAIDSYPRL